MKSLKITLVAIFSVVLLTGVSVLNTEPTQEETKNETPKTIVDISVMKDKKKVQPPTNG
ncbi:hypothetical protein [Olleya sp. R77988]|uniref:hypothetical protein n=1 Tax=Olleya sp. R77988 TaxID=3093875 RepID=UPI0037C99952